MLWWILENLILSAVLAAAVGVVCQFRGVGPATRHALWLVVLAKLITPPFLVWPWAISNPLAKVEAGIVQMSPERLADLPHRKSTVRDSAPRESPPPTAVTPSDKPQDPTSPHDSEFVFMPDRGTGSASGKPVRTTDAQPAPTTLTIETTVPASFDFRVWLAWVWPAAGGVWLLGSVAFVAREAVRIANMLRRLRRAEPADDALVREVRQMAARLRMRPIETTKVSGVGSPFVWAIVCPRLVWPAELPSDLPPDSLRGLILHELAHVKRRDHWVGWLELVGGSLWWWNPFLWYVRGQVRENAELACDAWVVGELPKGRRAYAEALLTVCECISQATAPLPAVGASSSDRRLIQRRLTMILRDRVPIRLSRAGMLAAFLLGVSTLPAWSQAPVAKPIEIEAAIEFVGEPEAVPAAPDARARRYRVEVGREFSLKIPPELSAAMRRFEAQEAAVRQEAEAKIAQSREALWRELQDLQLRLAKEGRAEEAAAIGTLLRQAREAAVKAGGGGAAPAWLVEYRGRIGESFVFDVTGSLDGIVWGTDVYTDDSSLAAATVHAGLLTIGQRGKVRATILPGKDSYTGSSRNGVISMSYGSWQGSYRLEAVKEATTAKAVSDPGTLWEYRGRVGQTLSFEVVGDTGGIVWGSDVYTDDSRLATAAVHAGILEVGQRGVVQVQLLPGQESYAGSTRNGVVSNPYGRWDGSYRFVRGGRAGAGPKAEADPGSLTGYRDRVGQTFAFRVVGSTREDQYAIWGTGVYTDDSSLAMAAVHAGVLREGQSGVVHVTILPGQDAYAGSTKNGVTSRYYESWGGSYRIVGARPAEEFRRTRTSRGFPYSTSAFPGSDKGSAERKVGDSFVETLVGTTEGVVWGTDVYTDDSSLAAAAVHAGVLEPGERAAIRITVLEGRDSYTPSNRNGIATSGWGAWPRSLKFERVTTK